jgi:alpha-tubulin suppressor-like RCC1 family protein
MDDFILWRPNPVIAWAVLVLVTETGKRKNTMKSMNPGFVKRWQSALVCVLLWAAYAFTFRCEADSGTVVSWGYNCCGQATVPEGLTNVVAVSAGEGNHSLALREDGTLVGWGSLGAVESNVTAIAAGEAHNLALKADGTVLAWGNYFVTGGGSMPAFVPAGLSNVIAIAAGAEHDLALKADGTIAVWGSPNYCSPPPAGLSNVVAIAAGAGQNLALLADGTLTSWGNITYPLPAGLTNVAAIFANYYNFAALKRDGSIVLWGSNDYGQLQSPVALSSNLLAIACGMESYLALQDDGTLIAWGSNYGQQTNLPPVTDPAIGLSSGGGHGLAILRPSAPVFLQQPTNCTAFTGRSATFRVRVYGSLAAYQWQLNGRELPGATNATLTLTNVQPADAGWYRVAVSNRLGSVLSCEAQLSTLDSPPSLAQGPSNTVACLGGPAVFTVVPEGSGPFHFQWRFKGADLSGATNAVLQLDHVSLSGVGPYSVRVTNPFGDTCSAEASLSIVNVLAWGNNDSGQCAVPVSATNVLTVACGQSHSLALRADGSLLSWGAMTDIPSPATNVIAIAAGFSNNLALRADGSLVAWGNDDFGQNEVPTEATNVVGIATGGRHSLALRADGSLVAWGANEWSQASVPPTATNLIAVAAGEAHSVALRADGTVLAWGNNDLHQTEVPAEATNIVGIACGAAHSLALKANGTVLAWGYSVDGQTAVPVTLSNVTAIAAGRCDSLALQRDGTLTGWGGNWYGEGQPPAGYIHFSALATSFSHSLAVVRWPAAPRLDAAGCHWDALSGGFQLRLRELSGSWPVVIQTSTNLLDWTPLLTNPPAGTSANLLDVSALNSAVRFYRAFEQ